MNDKKQIERLAQNAIQDAVGIPPTQLRGIEATDHLQSFIARSFAQEAQKPAAQALPNAEVKSTVTTNFPPPNIKTNEQPLPVNQNGGDTGTPGTPATFRVVRDGGGTPFADTANLLEV